MLRALALLFAAVPLAAQYPPVLPGAPEEVHKTIGETRLRLWIFTPDQPSNPQPRPAIGFFFGGGRTSGTPGQLEQQAKLLRARGMVAIVADYRVASRHQVKADACVRDAKPALRYVRANARRLGIDPNRSAAGGGSAGGHLAAATAALPGFAEAGEDTAISSRPNALVLFNPVLVLRAVAGAGLPTDPEPLASIARYRDRAVSLGIACGLVRYPGQTHGFFNYGRANNEFFEETTARMVAFLDQLGYLPGA